MAAAPRDYQASVNALMALQTNAAVLEALKDSHQRSAMYPRSIPEMLTYAERVGLTPDVLKPLRIVHVAGTKGKGSTCAFLESIFRKHGLKTGLFTSPHLMETRERIRVNGLSISEATFAASFWAIWDALQTKATPADDFSTHPMFFRYVTLMGLHVFVQEKVDVAIVEVGVGGEYDATNFIADPAVCAIASLGYDHLDVLGETLPEIAWHKAGIAKPGCLAVTAQQRPEAMKALQVRISEKKGHLYAAPLFSSLPGLPNPVPLGLAGEHQVMNAELAVAAAMAWLSRERGQYQDLLRLDSLQGSTADADAPPVVPIKSVPPLILEALSETHWAGRAQRIQYRNGVTYFLDGAHTFESGHACAQWFHGVQMRETAPKPYRVLIFNCKPTKEPSWLLVPLAAIQQMELPFEHLVFCTNEVRGATTHTNNSAVAAAKLASAADASRGVKSEPLSWQHKCAATWTTALTTPLDLMRGSVHPPPPVEAALVEAAATIEARGVCAGRAPATIAVVDSITAAMEHVDGIARARRETTPSCEIHTLVTGSLYLIGGFMVALEQHVT